MKIISLVPSLTELVIDLSLVSELVGRTKFCIHPKEKVKFIPKIGGTKNVDIAKVADLKPDLILANKEENTRKDVEELVKIAPVHVTDISNYSEALESIQNIGLLTNRQKEAQLLIDKINSRFAKLTEFSGTKKSVCYLIWQDALMTIGRDTYIHDMLFKCGFDNVFGNEERYPTVTENDIIEKNPDFIFLSSEPFPFKETHIDRFSEMFPKSKVVLVDGEYFSWYGSRMVLAADYFNSLLQEL